MQVTVVHAEGAANESNNLVSIRAANARRQGGVQLGKPLQFPVSVADANLFKIDVLRQICVGHETLAAEDADYRIALESVGEASGDSAASVTPKSISLKVKNNIHLCGRSRQELKVSTSAAISTELGCPVSEPIADIEFSDVHADVKGGISAVMEARQYFDSHNIMRVVRALLEAIIREQPADPFDFISKFMDSCSEQCEKASSESKDDSSARWPNSCCQYPKEWVDTFNAVDLACTGELKADTFFVAIRQLYPTLSQEQALALCYGVSPLGKINLAAFCAVAASLEQGEATAAEVAGLSVDDFMALAHPTLQEVSPTIQVNHGTVDVLEQALSTELAMENEAKEDDDRSSAEEEHEGLAVEFADVVAQAKNAKVEADRLASEFVAKEDANRLEQEKVVVEKAEADKFAAENAAKEDADKLAAEKEKERFAAEFVAKVEADRVASEFAAKEVSERLEQERVAAEKAEADRVAAENAAKEDDDILAAEEEEQVGSVVEFADVVAQAKNAKIEADRLASEFAAKEHADRLEQERVAAEKAEADRLAVENAAKEDADKLAAEKEQERLAAEFVAKVEADRLASEIASKENAERLEQEKVAADKAEADRLAAEIVAKEGLAVVREHERFVAGVNRLVGEHGTREELGKRQNKVLEEQPDAAKKEHARFSEIGEKLIEEATVDASTRLLKERLTREVEKTCGLLIAAADDGRLEKAMLLAKAAPDDENLLGSVCEQTRDLLVAAVEAGHFEVLSRKALIDVDVVRGRLPDEERSPASHPVRIEQTDSSALNVAREQMRDMLVSALQDGLQSTSSTDDVRSSTDKDAEKTSDAGQGVKEVREKTRVVLLEALEDGALEQCLSYSRHSRHSFTTERVRLKIENSLRNALQDGTMSRAIKMVLEDQVRDDIRNALASALDDNTIDAAVQAGSTRIKEDSGVIHGQPDENHVQKEELRKSIQSELARASVDGSLSEFIQEAWKEEEETLTRQGQDTNMVHVPVPPNVPRPASSFVRSAEQSQTNRDS